MTRRIPSTLLAAVLTCLALPASAQSANPVAGEKLDNGLGSLPHYSKWASASGLKMAAVKVEGESLDNQLGNLPHYRLWTDRTGKDPMGTQTAAVVRYSNAKSAAKADVNTGERVAQALN